MRFKVIDANSVTSIFRTLAEFMPDVTLVGTKEGIKIRGVDPSRVTLVNLFIPKGYFHEYESGEKDLLTVKLQDLIDSLSSVRKNDSLTFELKESSLYVTLDGEFERTFVLPILSGEEGTYPSLQLELNAKVKMLTSTFSEVMRVLSDLGKTVTLSFEEGKLVISVEGDIGSSKIELTEDSGLLEASGSEAKSTYSLDYLEKTVNMRDSSDVVELNFGTQLPLKLRFELPQDGYGEFYIAPRAE
ncbi:MULTISPECIES: DNA polymerase III sliding clamp [Metallosphaera]|uniref:DNA polymerase sliding clamp n=1 Tax=Metallosphaera cuprina (strain Ar-4) TaxID=1006006 RepID=F4G050_METCR|nr:DNA polymerase III sliding clamp [Metallosphaera cuprina]AEB94549.1 proliferating cell nuclear antigen [Metallosphaera cuprina Ar-4]